jgi:hypothetical protein
MEKQKDVDVLLSEIQENNPRQFDRLALILDRERKAKATKDAMYMVTTKAIKKLSANNNNIRELTEIEIKKVHAVWDKYKFAVSNDIEIQKTYSSLSGRFNPYYMGDGIHEILLKNLNYEHIFHIAFPDKNYLDLIMPQFRHPVVVGRRINEYYMDATRQIVSKEEFIDSLHKVVTPKDSAGRELIIKPKLGGRGARIKFVAPGSSIDAIKMQIDSYDLNDQLVVQEIIQGHEACRRPHPESLNTLRIASFLYEGEVRICGTVFRMGQGELKVDNFAQGGVICPVDKEGKCGEYLVASNGEVLKRHPSSGFEIKGHMIPYLDRSYSLIKEAHQTIPQIRYIAWDIVPDVDGTPILIELNPGGDSSLLQVCGFLPYGALTEKILDKYLLHQYYENRSTFDFSINEYSSYVELTYWARVDDKVVIIPSRWENKPITKIQTNCFQSDVIEYVIVPATVKEICSRAFIGCSRLKKVIYEGDVAKLKNDDSSIKDILA